MRAAVAVMVAAWSSIANASPGEPPARFVGELSFNGGAFYAPGAGMDAWGRDWAQLYGVGASAGAEVRPQLAVLAHATLLWGNREDGALFAGPIVWYRDRNVRIGGGAGLTIKLINVGDDHGYKHDLVGLGGTLTAEVVVSAFAVGVELNVDMLTLVNAAGPAAPWPLLMFTIGVGRP